MIRIVLCNCTPDEAPTLARRLVEEHLAACVNIIGPVQSIYRWKGEICDDQEATLLIKTSDERYDELVQKLRQYHSYDVPEIIAIDTAHVDDAYANWVYDQLR